MACQSLGKVNPFNIIVLQSLISMKKYLFLLCFSLIFAVFCTPTASAQPRLNADSKGIIYNEERVFDFRAQTYGWFAFNYQVGKIRSYYKTTFYNFGIGELLHHQEIGKTSEYVTAGGNSGAFSSYTFGKQNSAFPLRVGYGVKRYYTEKAEKNGVAVAVVYQGGLSLAMLKPYYLEIQATRDGLPKSTRYSPETEANFLNVYKIREHSGFFKGIGETSFVPGLYGQLGVQVDWGAFDEFVRAIEIGIQLDVYPKKLPIVVSDQNRPFFLNFYVSLQLGSRQ